MATYKTCPTDYERLGKLAMRAQTQLARTAMILQSMTNAWATERPLKKPAKPTAAAVIGRAVPGVDEAKPITSATTAPEVRAAALDRRVGEVVLRG